MTRTSANTSPIGVTDIVDGRVFARGTPRGVLADALQEAGRMWEAELLRSADPVVLARRVRMPHAGDVAAAVARLLPDDPGSTLQLEGRPGAEFDALAWALPDGTPFTETGWWLRWPAEDTPTVFATAVRMLRGRRRS